MIKFIANYRGKSKQSRILKALCDPKYWIIKTSWDDIWITFNIDWEFKNLITFIKLIIRFIRNHNNRKNSKILSISEIWVKWFENNKVHTVLRKSPFNIFTITTDIKNVSWDLNEIKLNLRYDGSWVEIKFHLSDNENEIWIQDHRLYKLHTRILWLTIRFWNRKIITESKYRKKAKEVINKIFTEDTKSKYKLLQDLSKYGLPPQWATIDEVVEALLSRYKSNNITLENYQITNLHWLISGSLELPEVNLQVSKTVEEIDNVMQWKPA
jgi:hypothetical protein